MDTRSFIKVVSDTRQPSPGLPKISLFMNSRIGEINFVELGFAGHLPQRTNINRWVVHVDDECTEASMLNRFSVGTDHEQTETGQMAKRRPDLLAVTDPFVTVADTPRRKPAKSDPAPGSLNNWHQISSHVNSGRK